MGSAFHHFASRIAGAAGHWGAFTAAVALIAGWAASGPFLGFSEIWQLTINTATTIVTFLMVFLIQHTQNRDTEALHAKIDELIRAMPAADDRLRGIESEEGA